MKNTLWSIYDEAGNQLICVKEATAKRLNPLEKPRMIPVIDGQYVDVGDLGIIHPTRSDLNEEAKKSAMNKLLILGLTEEELRAILK